MRINLTTSPKKGALFLSCTSVCMMFLFAIMETN